jgi:heme A synthase
MRTTYRVLAYLLAAEVLIQGMAIAFGLAGLGKWIDDGHSATKALFDNSNASFGGKTGFMIHGMNGTMIIPILVLLMLIVSFFSKVPGASKRAGILVGLVVLQVVLGITAHSLPAAILLHVLNAFGIFVLAGITAIRLGTRSDTVAAAETPVLV